ncbi:MAG: bacteriophage Gp15 family protein, partial [Desulfobacterales bacterium]|nr:bacteriophage Gp15 family protein [Desulfobacterales bacterium]
FSFSKDANLIYAAFKQTHGIDLQREKLHWWQFLALFMDLGPDTTFCSLVSLRKRRMAGKLTKAEREAVSELGDWMDVPQPDNRTAEEKRKDEDFERRYQAAKAKERL